MTDMNDVEVIAVVLPPHASGTEAELQDFVATGTMLLVRHADGRLSLEPTRRDPVSVDRARAAGCVYKSRAIHDPLSCEVVGHELEIAILSGSTLMPPCVFPAGGIFL